MPRTNLITRLLALAGTALVWFPLLMPVVLALVVAFIAREVHFDYLMPAELFPLALVGSALLIWAALRSHAHRRLIVGGFVLAIALLVGGQALAVVTGLASGDIASSGWPLFVVLGSVIAYGLALTAVGVGGLLLLRDLFRRPPGPVTAA